MLLVFLLLAVLAGLANVWPMALASAVLGALLHAAQNADDAVADTANTAAEGASAGTAVLLLLMWVGVGLVGLVVLGLATTEVLR